MKNNRDQNILFAIFLKKFKMYFFERLDSFLSDNPLEISDSFTTYLLNNSNITKKEIYNILDIKNTDWSKAIKKGKIINSLATPDWNDLSDGDLLDEEIEIFNYEEDKSTLNTSFSGTEEAYDLYEEANLLGTDLFEEIQKMELRF